MTLQATVASLRDDVDDILDTRLPEPEARPAEAAKDTVLAALFQTTKLHHRHHVIRPRGISQERVMRLMLGRESVLSWRLRGEPH